MRLGWLALKLVHYSGLSRFFGLNAIRKSGLDAYRRIRRDVLEENMKNTSIKPNFAATALSCVPYRDAAHCVQVILENFPEAPFLPVLTRSLRYQLEGFPCIVFNRGKTGNHHGAAGREGGRTPRIL